jgi:hypothetical protein
MSRVIHARIDEETDKTLKELRRRLGWNDSNIVREGIKALSFMLVRRRKQRIVGLGSFESGIPDLGSNKQHLEGFGL